MMEDDHAHDRPWTEDEWEQLFRRSDVRSARYGELWETLRDHPDRDEIIAREMGWTRCLADESSETLDLDTSADGDALDLDPEREEIARRKDEMLGAIPAYSHGQDWGLRVHRTLQPYLELDPTAELEPDDPLVTAFSDSLVVSVKIAGGHCIGYDEDSICGNIVCCKRAWEAAERAVRALEELVESGGPVPAEVIRPLLEDGRQVRALVQQHIAELRSRVWWQ